jgi:hypothetical protein
MRCDLELRTWKLENFVHMKWIDNIEKYSVDAAFCEQEQ